MEMELNIPQGESAEDIEVRRNIILQFYHQWKEQNPLQKRYNLALNEYINIRQVSLIETSAHASRTYLSALAVMQLDAILTNARPVARLPIKQKTKNQQPFDHMLIMVYDCVGIGRVKMTVGIKKQSFEKVQYCITTLEVGEPLIQPKNKKQNKCGKKKDSTPSRNE